MCLMEGGGNVGSSISPNIYGKPKKSMPANPEKVCSRELNRKNGFKIKNFSKVLFES